MRIVLMTVTAVATSLSVMYSVAASGSETNWQREDFAGPSARSPAQALPAKPRMTAEMTDRGFRLVDGGSQKGDLLTFPRYWCAIPEDGAACRASVKVVRCAGLAGVLLGFSDGVHEDLLTLYEDRIELHWAKLKHAMDTTETFHEYRVDIRGTDVWVSVDGRRVIAGAGKFTYPAHNGRNRFSFGSGASVSQGESLWQGVSHDRGRTWQARKTGVKGHPPSGLVALGDGRLVLTYGYRHPPYGIRAVISNDEGLTWDTDHVIVLRNDGAGFDLGYPCSMELEDGTILTVYYFTDDESVTHIACTRWRAPE